MLAAFRLRRSGFVVDGKRSSPDTASTNTPNTITANFGTDTAPRSNHASDAGNRNGSDTGQDMGELPGAPIGGIWVPRQHDWRESKQLRDI